MGQTADVVVVGGGAGGGVAAARLSEHTGLRVVLLEAGPDFPDELQAPPAFFTGGNSFGEHFAGAGAPTPELDWGYVSEPLRNGRAVRLDRGRLVGGSTMINGCIAVRARPSDFEDWVERGALGWGWQDVEPFYELVEREIAIKTYPEETWMPIQRLCLEAFVELGYRFEPDLNGPGAWDGVVGPWPQNRRNEIRLGTLVTYIRAARTRSNFTVIGDATVDRVLFDGDRVVGVRYVDANSGPQEIAVENVVLAGGAYGSPSILLRSGIGPADELRQLGISVKADLPTGRRLMDHPGTMFPFEAPPELARMIGPGNAVVARGRGWWGAPHATDEVR
jgi:choline dehydrogenase